MDHCLYFRLSSKDCSIGPSVNVKQNGKIESTGGKNRLESINLCRKTCQQRATQRAIKHPHSIERYVNHMGIVV